MANKPDGAADSELVMVFDTQQESEAMVVQGLLESAGIESMMISLDAPQDVLPGVGGVQIKVSPDQFAIAEEIIAEFRAHPATDAEMSAADPGAGTDA